MIADILTVMWKERKGLFRAQGSRSRMLLTVFVPIVTIAVLLPLQLRDWLTTAFPLFAAVVIPLLMVGTAIPQSFAGERERHTLATLLASRLPDGAILFGKWALAVVYGWVMTLVVLAAAAVTANVARWSGQVAFYRADMALAHITVGLLMSGLIASLGVLVSLRSATTQGAQQALMGAILVPAMILQVVPALLLGVVPNGRDILGRVLSMDFRVFATVTVAILAVLNLGLLWAAVVSFRRERLISGCGLLPAT